MTGPSLENCLEHELKYQFRKRIAEECRKQCPDADPMVTNITVMLGTVLAMVAFTAILKSSKSGRTR